ncbi:hypothetical protein [Hydrogenovibrio marinus]|uniref:hypothetical protein n=1 Tax=Hydrogenovibrio marinus TaxID=28885 RepID=UPI001E3AEDBA|nr:hypothetical protein [Hydrogenovibrio marinus]
MEEDEFCRFSPCHTTNGIAATNHTEQSSNKSYKKAKSILNGNMFKAWFKLYQVANNNLFCFKSQ